MPTLSFVLAIISLALWYRFAKGQTQEAKLVHEQDLQMVEIASRTVVLSQQIKTIAFTTVHDEDLDNYIFSSIRKNAVRLEESLDRGLALGLWPHIVSSKRNARPMYTAFIQALLNAAEPDNAAEEWTKMHLTMGIWRTLELCDNYKRFGVKDIVKEEFSSYNKLGIDPWKYLEREVNDA